MDDLQFTSTVPFSDWPSTFIGHVWLYDTNHPQTLYASVVHAEKTKTTIEVSCPTSVSGCGDGYGPETITRYGRQYYGASLIRGEKTAGATTTAWVCDLEPNGSSMGEDGIVNVSMEDGQDLKCAATTGKDINIKDLEPTAFHGECFSLARPALAYTTAGLDALKDTYPYYGQQEAVKGGMKEIAKELSAAMRGDFESVCTSKKEDLEDAQVTSWTKTAVAAKTTSGEVKETGKASDDNEDEDNSEGKDEKDGSDEKKDDDKEKSDDEEKKDDDSGSVRLSTASISMGLMVIAAALVNL